MAAETIIAAVGRFVRRLHLPPGAKFTLRSIQVSRRISIEQRFGEAKLELYHSARDDWDGAKAQRIFKKGFTSWARSGNKGPGLYLANHGRYAWLWAGARTPVLICHVPAHAVTRYHSEIYSPMAGASEYVCHKPELAIARYLMHYSIDCGGRVANVWTKTFGCWRCDTAGAQCDCPQPPLVSDLVGPPF